MPLVRHLGLPSFTELERQGQPILSLDQATHQDIRELHIGFLNMMPDAALEVTERQFLRLVGSCNQIAQFYVHPFTVPGLSRSPQTAAYLESFYRPWQDVMAQGLDALIITGANVTRPDLHREPFWQPLMEVINWATETVTSVMCSCLATHAVLTNLYGLQRQRLPQKRWGVYQHRSSRLNHPLLRDINTRFDVPHSRWNTIPAQAMLEYGIKPLVVDQSGEVHLAVSPDGLRVVYSQGHPEYDANSLLKEYKREVLRFQAGELADYPPAPENIFSPEAEAIVTAYRDHLLEGGSDPFPEDELLYWLDNTWGDTGKAVFNNWLGLVYQLTHLDRRRPFLEGIDPQNPIGWRQANKGGNHET